MMNRKEEIKKDYYSFESFRIILCLCLFSCFFLYLSGFHKIENLSMFLDYLMNYHIAFLLCVFFLGVCLYFCISYYLNIILPPQSDVLYLLEKDKNTLIFVDSKGKKYEFFDCDKKVHEYYNVLKTRDYLYDVFDVSSSNFDLSNKKVSYWLNFYSPMGNFENLMLLPVIYIILFPGILSFVFTSGYGRIFGFIYSIPPIFILIYDFLYKRKLSRGEDSKKMEESSKLFFEKASFLFIYGFQLILLIPLDCFLFYVFVKIPELLFQLILIPFLLCFLCLTGQVVSKLFHKEKFAKLFSKGYLISFLLYWFGFLVLFDYLSIFQEKSFLMVIISIPLWTIGLYVVYNNFVRKKER